VRLAHRRREESGLTNSSRTPGLKARAGLLSASSSLTGILRRWHPVRRAGNLRCSYRSRETGVRSAAVNLLCPANLSRLGEGSAHADRLASGGFSGRKPEVSCNVFGLLALLVLFADELVDRNPGSPR
jgi:hypothetical protein